MRLSPLLLALSLAAPLGAQAPAAIPTPKDVLGFDPGDDRKLPEWSKMVEYFQKLDQASPRVSVRTLGKTALGRPFLAAFISDPANLAKLPRLQEIQRKLADPRTQRPGERAALLAEGKVVILVD